MSFAMKKQGPQERAPQVAVQIHVGRDAVNNASRQTSETINQMTDQIAREISKQLQEK
ncbi:hypothetical protein [Bradyrhizobium sp.]|uniref:hypothetical protein n=1 Tax=Bradyrhizobium sp. TaxID=376 RepID=UPI0026360469|nr:hypothetical protein [Bradyrhizobium sp.]